MIGLTGPIAAGKSTVAEMLRECGAEIIDADAVYRSLVTPGSKLLARIVDRFGADVVLPDGALDRHTLGGIVFRDPGALRDLERLTHPAVVAAIRDSIATSTAPVIVVEAIKLVESGLVDDVDALWLVDAAPEMRARRLMARNGIGAEEAAARLASARPVLPRGTMPEVTIDNSGDREATRAAVAAALEASSIRCETRSTAG
ncbi:MAG: dephospho-CoA kinase [Thermomicrobiales bacterium]|nr:dephospho-CoA kinase [Thermomicrobiales bacterium]